MHLNCRTTKNTFDPSCSNHETFRHPEGGYSNFSVLVLGKIAGRPNTFMMVDLWWSARLGPSFLKRRLSFLHYI